MVCPSKANRAEAVQLYVAVAEERMAQERKNSQRQRLSRAYLFLCVRRVADAPWTRLRPTGRCPVVYYRQEIRQARAEKSRRLTA